MKKTLKISGIVLAVILAVMIIVPFALRGKLADIVKKEANAMLNARLDFEKLDISLLRHFPRASLDLKGLTLVGVDRFEGDTIVAAHRISVVVDVMSLFSDSGFEVTKVILAKPAVHAHKLADGAVNWDVMKPSEEPGAEEEVTDESPSTFRLSIRDFRINNAEIRYEDDSMKMSFSTAPLDLLLKGDMTADQTDLNLRATAKQMNFSMDGIRMLNGAEAELDAVISADLKNNRYTLSDNKLRLNAIEMNLDGWVELRDETIAMDLTAGCDKVQFKDILSMIPAFYTKDYRGLQAGGELSMSAWVRGEMEGSDFPAFEVKTAVKDGSFQYAALPKAVTNINVNARVANPGGVLDKTEVEVSKFTMHMAGNDLLASFYATNLLTDPFFRVGADGRVDLGAIREVYPLEEGIQLGGIVTADIKLSARMSDIDKQRYEKIAAAGTFVVENMDVAMSGIPAVHIRRAAATITPATMTLGELGVKVGNSDLAANGQLSNYIGWFMRDDVLSGRLYVKSELLDLNELMTYVPESEEETAPEAAEPMQAIEIPKNLNLSLNTDLREVLFQKMTISDISGEMRMKDGTLSLDRLKMKLFDGTASASGSYSTAADPKRPALKLVMNMAGASFQKTFEQLEMVQQLVPIFAKTGGDYSMTLDMTSALDAQMSPDLHSVNAAGEIKSANIKIQNLEAFEKLASALGSDAVKNIDAKDVAVKFTIKDGRLNTQPFDLKLGAANLNMSGSTGLDQTINYKGKVSLPASATKGLLQNVGFGIGGTFTSPKVTVDLKDAASEAVKSLVDQQIQKLTGSESLSAEVEKQAARLREESQKQADRLRSEAVKAGDKLREESVKAGDKLVEAAVSQRAKLVEAATPKGALAKIAAEKSGDKLVDEAKKQAAKLTAEADKQAVNLSAEAEKQAANLTAETEKQVEKLSAKTE